MNKKTMRMMLLRAIEGAETGGSAGTQSTNENAQNGADSGEGKGGDSEQSGSGTNDIDVDKIRHDLSAEWSGRVDAEKARADELQKKLDEYEKSKMSEEERAAVAEQEWKARVDKLMAENAEMKLKHERGELCKEFKIPDAMAHRIMGETPEERRADAEALSKALGFDRAPQDPTQGKGGDAAAKPRSFAEAIARNMNMGRE